MKRQCWLLVPTRKVRRRKSECLRVKLSKLEIRKFPSHRFPISVADIRCHAEQHPYSPLKRNGDDFKGLNFHGDAVLQTAADAVADETARQMGFAQAEAQVLQLRPA